MSKRDLLKKANTANVQNRGTDTVLNETPVPAKEEKKVEPVAQSTPVSAAKPQEKPAESAKAKEKKEAEAVEPKVNKDTDTLPAQVKTSKPAKKTNISKYTAAKVSKSIMLTAEDNRYLIRTASATAKSIQDVFAEVMADEIEEVKKGNIDAELAESFLKLKAGNERRNVMIPGDLVKAIADTATLVPLKQGKFILYALQKKRDSLTK